MGIVTAQAAVARARPDVIINELTSLPKHYTHPPDMKAAAERDARVRSLSMALQRFMQRAFNQFTRNASVFEKARSSEGGNFEALCLLSPQTAEAAARGFAANC